MTMCQLIKNWEVCIKARCHASIKLANIDINIITNEILELMSGPVLNVMIKLSVVPNSYI